MSKLKRESAREQIRDSILRGIHDGKYPPGFKLKEKVLAESFGTSQAPVREALRELEGLQYIETIPYKGSVVKEVSREDFITAYKLRKVFEQMALEALCEKDLIDFDELEDIAHKVEEAAKQNDRALYSEYNVAFHEYFIEKSGIAMLKRMWKLVTFPTQIETVLDTIDVPLIAFSKEHFDIIDALKRKDVETACRLLGDHIDAIRRYLQK